jgi:D-lactate dehydrogenase
MKFIKKANSQSIEISYCEKSLSEKTAILAKGFHAISIFTSDDASAEVLNKLSKIGINYIAIRASGYDNIDLNAAERLGIKVANVPKYSPNAIAEHAVALMLFLNRKISIADKLVHQYNFKIDRLIGFDMSNKTVGIIGTGNIGSVVSRILSGFGCNLIGFDIKKNKYLENQFNLKYTSLENIYKESDIISIHIPLNKETKYIINEDSLSLMKKEAMIINTSRGAIVNTKDLIKYLQKGEIGYYGADVYENEKDIFFQDLSSKKIKDSLLNKLLSFENVLITPHQAFATTEALEKIAEINISNLQCWDKNQHCENEINEIK